MQSQDSWFERLASDTVGPPLAEYHKWERGEIQLTRSQEKWLALRVIVLVWTFLPGLRLIRMMRRDW